MSGSRNSGWRRSLFSPETKAAGAEELESTSIANEEITAVMPIVSSALRSVEAISTGVIASSAMCVKLALKSVASLRIIFSSTEIGSRTSLLRTVWSESMTTMMKVFAST